MGLGIVLGIVLFLFLVVIHELGHFFAAKKSGVQVLEFGVGIPPKILTLGKDKSGTEYTLNALPLGGFVRLKGEDPNDSETFHAKDSFMSASFFKKFVILLAGVVVNFVFARAVLTVLFTRGMSPLGVVPTQDVIASYLTPSVGFLQSEGLIDEEETMNGVRVDEIIEGSLAEDIGLLSGDNILKVNNTAVSTFSFSNILEDTKKDIVLEIEREGKKMELNGMCDDSDEGGCTLGVRYVQSDDFSNLDLEFQFSLGESMRASLNELKMQGSMTIEKLGSLLGSLVSGDKKKTEKELEGLVGPVGAVKIGESLIVGNNRDGFLAFGAMISFALAIFNVLPIPALDGGRLLGVVIQSLFFRKRVEKYFAIEGVINFVFFALLMVLGVYIILRDLVTIRGVSIPFM